MTDILNPAPAAPAADDNWEKAAGLVVAHFVKAIRAEADDTKAASLLGQLPAALDRAATLATQVAALVAPDATAAKPVVS